MMAPPSPYRAVEVAPGHIRLQPDFAASRAIAADITARERAEAEARAPIWQKLARRFAARKAVRA